MKKIALVLLATAALAVPAAADACHGGRHHARTSAARLGAWEHGLKLGWWMHGALFARLTGTGSSFAGATATSTGTLVGRPLANGTYSASLATDWTKAVANEHGGSCAPATGTLTLTDASSSANAVSETLTGKTCSVGTNRWNVAYVFVAHSTVSTATGTLAGVGHDGRVLLAEKADGTVMGFAFTGLHGWKAHTMAAAADRDAHHWGDRDD